MGVASQALCRIRGVYTVLPAELKLMVRRTAVRLLLDAYRDEMGTRSAYTFPHTASIEELGLALEALGRVAPNRRAFVDRFIQRGERIRRLGREGAYGATYEALKGPLEPSTQQELDKSCDWLAERMGDRIVVPDEAATSTAGPWRTKRWSSTMLTSSWASCAVRGTPPTTSSGMTTTIGRETRRVGMKHGPTRLSYGHSRRRTTQTGLRRHERTTAS